MENPGSDLADSALSPEPSHPLTGVVSTLRRVAFVLLFAGAGGAAVWFGDVRLSAPGGTFTSVAVGLGAATLFLAATMAVLAYVLDLLIYANSSPSLHPGTVECRPLTTA